MHSIDAKCSAMKTLAEQVQSFIDAQPSIKGKPYSKATLAQAVAAHQKHLPDEERCKRQHIESLLKKNLKTTLYIVPLAKAMGTDPETLYYGRYKPAPTQSPEEALDEWVTERRSVMETSAPTYLQPSNPGIGYLAWRMVEKMKLLDESQRETAGAALRSFALWPERAAPQIEALASMLGESTLRDEFTDTGTR